MTFYKLLVWLGLGIVAVGLVLDFAPGLLSWFGKLPGDIHISGKNGFLFLPITSMLVISVALSLLFSLLTRK